MQKKFLIKIFVALFGVVLCSRLVAACSSNAKEKDDDYPVAGIWHASASWHMDNSYNFGGDTFRLDIWFDFREDGTMKTRMTQSVNGISLNGDLANWTIVNLTWTVKKNVITLSSGKQYVIVDDEFNDTYPEPKMILRYKKETANSGR